MAYGFDADRRLVWFAPLTEEGPAAGALCHRHAASMALPKGWWLDDRRVETPTLFAPPDPVAAREGRPTSARRERRRPSSAPSLPLVDQVSIEEAPAEVVPGATTVEDRTAVGEHDAEPWMPTFDTSDDLGGLLDAKTPLLARAFGRDRPTGGA